MKGRALEVRRAGGYLGLFEWVVWGHMHNHRVEMLFGLSVRELLAWFAPGLGPASPGLPERIARVAAVQCTARQGVWLAAQGSLPQMNHFVISVPSTKRQLDGTPGPKPSGAFTKCAKGAALRAGWLLKDTVSDGNCAPDTMAYYEGLERSQASYCLVRSRIADFMTAKAACPQWLDTFSAC